MPAVRRARTAAVATAGPLLLALVTGGLAACDSGPAPRAERSAKPSPSPTSTPLTAFDTSGLTVPRAVFCEQVAPADAQVALGGEAASSTSYDNGDRARLTPRVRDVAHEFGCTWTAEDGTRARAWVFTPPVTKVRARQLRRTLPKSPGCRPVPQAPAFGSPSVAVQCREPGRPPRVRTTFSGLFGDAWLSCEIEVARPDLAGVVDRTGEWCVTVARAASGTTS